MAEFRKWKSIDKFSDAYVKAQKFGVQKFKYRGKIKLHGTFNLKTELLIRKSAQILSPSKMITAGLQNSCRDLVLSRLRTT